MRERDEEEKSNAKIKTEQVNWAGFDIAKHGL